MQIQAEDILNYHCPRWNELPEIELYIDQVVCVLQNNLSIFSKEKDTQVITASMINNYVKQNILNAPVKKKYSKEHIAHLFVICIFKRLMSISEIGESITSMKRHYSVEEGYNLFCEELENSLKHIFNPNLGELKTFDKTDIREDATLIAMTTAFANSVLVDRLLLLRNNDKKVKK